MKRMLSVIVVFALLTAALPVAAAAAGQLWQPAAETNAGAPSEGVPETGDPFSPTPAPAASPTPVPEGRTLKVLDTGSGQVVDMVLERNMLNDGGIFVFEHSKDKSFDGHPRLYDTRNYGSVHFSIFR